MPAKRVDVDKPWDIDATSQDPSYTAGRRPKVVPPQSRGSPLLSAVGLAQPTLHVTLSEELLYLHPAPEGMPTEDPWVSGTVTLWLPKARNLRHLTVRLRRVEWEGNEENRRDWS